MDITSIQNQIALLNSQDRIRLLQAILVSAASEKVSLQIAESQQWELDRQMSSEDRTVFFDRIFALDIQDRMLLAQSITASISPERVESNIPESQQWEINRLKILEEQNTPQGLVAFEFATDLVNEKFEEAYSLLSPSIKDDWTPELLKDTYKEMVEYFGDLPVNHVSVDLVDTTLPEDNWVYVSIASDGGCEAITATIRSENGKYLIQKIEWGRP